MSAMIEITAADGHTFPAYVTGTQNAARSLILCHDTGGLNKYTRRVSDLTAAFGFRVIAPALFERAERGVELGWSPANTQRGSALADEIDPFDRILDIEAAAGELNAARIGILGFGLGATTAWHAAAHVVALRAGVGFYGTGIADARQETPLCPMQLHFGAWDRYITMADVDSIRRAQPTVEIEVYPTAGHLFACDESEAFDGDSTESARDNMLAFLQRYL